MNTDPLKRFMSRVRTAAQARTPEVRLPVAEANELAAAIAELLIVALENPQTKNNAVEPAAVQIQLDGGGLKK